MPASSAHSINGHSRQEKSRCDSKFNAQVTIALLNGLLYAFTIPENGGENIKQYFNLRGPVTDGLIHILSGISGLCYTMFCYKTLEALNLKTESGAAIALATLSPFAASGYLTGGVEGASLISAFPVELCAIVGVLLYAFRNVSCIDASFKFPERIGEIKQAWNKAWEEKDYKELTRLAITVISSLGFALSATDAVYAAVQIVIAWFGDPTTMLAQGISYAASGVGALGILPLCLYWTHRGLKQLTFGGRRDEEGVKKDPTDAYTYLGLMVVAPNALGVLGSTVSSTTTGKVFGRLGITAEVVRLTSSGVYAITSGTPGMGAFFRAGGRWLYKKVHGELAKPLLEDATPKEPPESGDSLQNFRGIQPKKGE